MPQMILAGMFIMGLVAVSTACRADGKPEERQVVQRPGQAGAWISLPAPQRRGSTSVEEALDRRRSTRAFLKQSIAQADLGQLLWAAQGSTGPGFRTAPSAGATYPLHVAAVVGMVDGIAPGIYVYDSGSHRIRLTRAGDFRTALSTEALGQSPVAAAPVVLVIAVDDTPTRARYGKRAERYVLIEAGHAAQNVHLQAVALGLGSLPVGAFDDAGVRSLLELPGNPAPIYLVPAGRPADR